MKICTHLQAAVVLLSCTVFAALPSPQNPTMDAVNTRYILRWDWNHKQRNITFTAEYTFSDLQTDERSYVGRCTGVTQKYCDFSDPLLSYSGSYVLRVRAEGWGSWSRWARLRFTPDEDAALGPPSHVRVEPGIAMATISFREPMSEQGAPMSSVLKHDMGFRLQYWDARTPSQKHNVTVGVTEHTLALQPWTEYCLQASAFSEEFDKASRYTQPQCVTTTGDRQLWLLFLAVVCVALLTVPIYTCYRKKKSLAPDFTIPDSILSRPGFQAPLLVEPQEESCVVSGLVEPQEESCVVSGLVEPQEESCVVSGLVQPQEESCVVSGLVQPQEESCVVSGLVEQVTGGVPGVLGARHAPLPCSRNSSSQDSGICSGEDSSSSVQDIFNNEKQILIPHSDSRSMLILWGAPKV